MAAKNDITGDTIQSRCSSDNYRNNFENIFSKKKDGDVSKSLSKLISVIDEDVVERALQKIEECEDYKQTKLIEIDYFEDAAEIYQYVMEAPFSSIDYVDNVVIYEMLLIITFDKDDPKLTDSVTLVAEHYLSDDQIERFRDFLTKYKNGEWNGT